MRVHGIQIRGLRAPAAEHRLALDPGYNLILAGSAEEARTVARAVEALLHPSAALAGIAGLARGPGDDATPAARAGIVVTVGGESLRLIVDVASGRLELARHEAASRTFQRVTLDPGRAEAYLCDRGRGPWPDFPGLHVTAVGACDPGGPLGAISQGAPPEDAGADRGEGPREEVPAPSRPLARLEDLRAASQKRTACEVAREALLTEISRYRPLVEVADLETRIDRFRKSLERRNADRADLAELRRSLIQERAHLRGAPGRQMVPLGIGAALIVSGGSVAWLGYGFGLVPMAAGGLAALYALGAVQLAKLRADRVESELAALRVRERDVEREYESDGAQVRGLLLAMALDSPEELEAAVAEYRRIAKRLDEADAALEAARSELPAELEAELARLEAEFARREELAQPQDAAFVAAPGDVGGPDETVEPDRDPDALVALASLGEEQAKAVFGPILSMYLRALTAGAYTAARRRQIEGWVFRVGETSSVATWSEIPAPMRPVVTLAFQLALLEGLAPKQRPFLLVGPDLPALGGEGERALSRAFARLGRLGQVIQVASDPGDYRERAARVVELGAPC